MSGNKRKWIEIISFKPAPFNWLNWVLAIGLYWSSFLSIHHDGWSAQVICSLLIGTVCLIDALRSNTPHWYLRAPNQTETNLYKIDGVYVAASTDEEAALWAMLTNIDEKIEPEKIGKVYYFEQ